MPKVSFLEPTRTHTVGQERTVRDQTQTSRRPWDAPKSHAELRPTFSESPSKRNAVLNPSDFDERRELEAACHCGAVRFRVVLSDGLRSMRRCNCSYCSMRGAVAVSANLDDIHVVQGADKLTLYQFNTGQAKHYFCSVCGIYTFHSRRSVPSQYGVNVACIAGLSPFDFEEVPVLEGRSHPKDRSDGGPMTAGWLSYRANTGQKR